MFNDLIYRFKRELSYCHAMTLKIILSMIAGAVLLFFSWTKFGGPCRITLLFKVPGGGITIAAYFVLWFVMFALCGGETAFICSIKNKCSYKILLYHIAAHFCLFLWYPLFFTTFSQLFALLILVASLIILLTELKECHCFSLIISASIILKAIVCTIFIYINIAFLIIN